MDPIGGTETKEGNWNLKEKSKVVHGIWILCTMFWILHILWSSLHFTTIFEIGRGTVRANNFTYLTQLSHIMKSPRQPGIWKMHSFRLCDIGTLTLDQHNQPVRYHNLYPLYLSIKSEVHQPYSFEETYFSILPLSRLSLEFFKFTRNLKDGSMALCDSSVINKTQEAKQPNFTSDFTQLLTHKGKAKLWFYLMTVLQ